MPSSSWTGINEENRCFTSYRGGGGWEAEGRRGQGTGNEEMSSLLILGLVILLGRAIG